ncbi:type II toxin-antitoxin system MqsA family antitoxin [Alcanivorax quisquiliarum]|uniref:Type II toxin-antitoxin system MqsA family antitoxin n=1 Tax=Alcanivorax quisquiliarum TaxID=2933565 RepID=A0ABT0E2S2_9GAMM|nr:type II toxin-antitoxin system MqsA family antitoxin [Alcanivorax quisquiliarum]MCK0536109.1 type II toxin-antitoxin system MqsA family antitoxin [Alcanivorax quisquiliarum]
MTINKCLVCDSDQIAEMLDDVPLRVGEFERTMQMRVTACASCGCSFHTAEQERHNKRQRLAFRKMVEGLLTGAEIRAIRQRHGLSQKQAAEIFGGGPVAFSKYEADDVAQSQAMDRLLRVFDAVPEAKAALLGEKVEALPVESLFEDENWRLVCLDMGHRLTTRSNDTHAYAFMRVLRRSLVDEEALKEPLSSVLKQHEAGTATRDVEWRPATHNAPEWRH